MSTQKNDPHRHSTARIRHPLRRHPASRSPFGFPDSVLHVSDCCTKGQLHRRVRRLILEDMAIKEKPQLVAIIDDNELVRTALGGLLKSVGFPALAFAHAEEFLASDRKHDTACLIADIHLPGMSGLELQSKLNAEHYRIPTIFITAHGDEEVRMQALRAGAVEFLTKPVDDEALLESVRAALEC
jgi:CheY-like chemotaxis protein